MHRVLPCRRIQRIFVLQKRKQANPTHIDMAKLQIKSEKTTLLGGIFSTRGAIFLHIDAPASHRDREAPTLFHTTVIQMLSSFC